MAKRIPSKERIRKVTVYDVLSLYMQDIQNTPVLTRKEEKELWQAIQKGDEKARKKFIEANLRLVVKIAKKYTGPALVMAIADIIQLGNLGIFKAMNSFDPRKGKFSTVATRAIKQSIVEGIDRQSRPVTLGKTIGDHHRHLFNAQRTFHRENGREPTLDELRALMGVSGKVFERILSFRVYAVSLDEKYKSEEGDGHDFLLISRESSPDECAERRSLQRAIERWLSALEPVERNVVKKLLQLQNGRAGKDPQMKVVGEELGLKEDALLKIRKQAFAKLRAMAEAEGVRP